jgi:hypothetical protein
VSILLLIVAYRLSTPGSLVTTYLEDPLMACTTSRNATVHHVHPLPIVSIPALFASASQSHFPGLRCACRIDRTTPHYEPYCSHPIISETTLRRFRFTNAILPLVGIDRYIPVGVQGTHPTRAAPYTPETLISFNYDKRLIATEPIYQGRKGMDSICTPSLSPPAFTPCPSSLVSSTRLSLFSSSGSSNSS